MKIFKKLFTLVSAITLLGSVANAQISGVRQIKNGGGVEISPESGRGIVTLTVSTAPKATNADRLGGYDYSHYATVNSTNNVTRPMSKVVGFTDECDYICDGTADESQINSAIAALSSGGQVILREGVYSVSSPITIDVDSITLTGQGQNTIIATDNSSYAETVGIHASGFHMRGIHFKPKHITKQLIIISTVTKKTEDILVENCVFTSTFTYSVMITTGISGGAFQIDNIRVQNCNFYIESDIVTCISLTSYGQAYSFSGNYFKYTGSAVNVLGSRGVSLINPSYKKISDVSFRDNTIYGMSGLYLSSVDRVVISGNILNGISVVSDSVGLVTQGGDISNGVPNTVRFVIISNNIIENYGAGITMTGNGWWSTSNIMVTGNFFRGCTNGVDTKISHDLDRQSYGWHIFNNEFLECTNSIVYAPGEYYNKVRNNIVDNVWVEGDDYDDVMYTDQVSTMTSNINMNNQFLVNVASPTDNTHVATKIYADSLVSPINDKMAQTVEPYDIEIASYTQGFVLNSPDKKWRLMVDNDGVISAMDVSPIITLVSPVGGESWATGAQTVVWTTSGSLSRVDIVISTDSGDHYNFTGANDIANAGTYEITIPTDAVASTCRVMVRDHYSLFYGSSPADLEIFEVPDGMLSWWKTTEGSGAVLTDCVSGKNGTIVNAAWTSDGGKDCLSYDGDGDYVSLGNNIYSTAELSSGTICMWIKPVSFDSTNSMIYDFKHCVLAKFRNWASTAFQMELYNPTQYQYLNELAGNTARDNNWHFVAFKWGNGNFDYYLDNVKLLTKTYNQPPPAFDSGSADFVYGANFTKDGDWFNGLMGQIRVFGKNLSTDEMTALYNAGR